MDDPVPVLHMYYHVKFGSSATKGVCINRRESPHIEERWSPTYLRQGRGLTRTTPSPYVLRRQIWLFCDKGCVHKNGRIPKTGQHWRRAPPNTCYHVNFGSAATKFVHINRREPPKLGSVRDSFGFRGGAWLTPKTKLPPHMCYHIKFGSSTSKGLCINRMEPQNGERRTCLGGSRCLNHSAHRIGTAYRRGRVQSPGQLVDFVFEL